MYLSTSYQSCLGSQPRVDARRAKKLKKNLNLVFDPQQHEPEDHVPQPQVHVACFRLQVLEDREILAHRHAGGELCIDELFDDQDPGHWRLSLKNALQRNPLLSRGRLADVNVVVLSVHRPRQDVLRQGSSLQCSLPSLNGSRMLIVDRACAAPAAGGAGSSGIVSVPSRIFFSPFSSK